MARCHFDMAWVALMWERGGVDLAFSWAGFSVDDKLGNRGSLLGCESVDVFRRRFMNQESTHRCVSERPNITSRPHILQAHLVLPLSVHK